MPITKQATKDATHLMTSLRAMIAFIAGTLPITAARRKVTDARFSGGRPALRATCAPVAHANASRGDDAMIRTVPRTTIAAVVTAAVLAAGAGIGLANRAPTAKERTAIIAGVRAGNQFIRQAPTACDRAAVIRVSTVDGRYAVWWQNAALASRISSRCAIGDGYVLMRLQPNRRWRIRSQEAFDHAPCRITGARIAKDLLPALPCG